MGLVKQAVSALTKRKIMQLTHTYITLPLSGKLGMQRLAAFYFARNAVRLCLAMPATIAACSLPSERNSPRVRVQISRTRWKWRTPMMPRATS